MKFPSILILLTIIFTLLLKSSHCMKVSGLQPWLLKPVMLTSKWFLANSFFGQKDYICTLTPELKAILCRKVFEFQPIHSTTKAKFDEERSRNHDYTCKDKTFNCYLNNYLRLGMYQAMLLCPLTAEVNGKVETITKYYISTNYTSGRVIVFEANEEGKVAAVVGLWDIDLLNLKP